MYDLNDLILTGLAFERGLSFSGWVLDVWDCRGTLKPLEAGVGYGSLFQLPKGWRWYRGQWFSFPVPRGTRVTQKRRAEIEKILYDVLESNGGAINISGWYPVSDEHIDAINATLKSNLNDLVIILNGEE